MAALSLAHGNLSVSGNCILSDVRENIILSPAGADHASFIGLNSDHRGSRVAFPVGKIR